MAGFSMDIKDVLLPSLLAERGAGGDFLTLHTHINGRCFKLAGFKNTDGSWSILNADKCAEQIRRSDETGEPLSDELPVDHELTIVGAVERRLTNFIAETTAPRATTQDEGHA